MDNKLSQSLQANQIISNLENDYNPFNIPLIELNDSNEFNPAVAIRGCPPFNSYTKAQFANLPIEVKAAYADGVVRGSYQKKWLDEQLELFDPQIDVNDSGIGAIAYVYLKTNNLNLLNQLKEWERINCNNTDKFF